MVISSSANAENERDQHKTLTNRRFKSQTSINENDELEEVDYDDDDDDVATDESDKNNGGSGSDESKETNSKTTGDKSTSQEQQQRNSSMSASKKVPKQKKWKPLVIEPAKRERRTYRNPQYQPDAYKLNNKRTRSLDRDNAQQQQPSPQQIHKQQQQENIKPTKDQAQASMQPPYTRPYQRPIRAARYDRSTKSYKTHRSSMSTTGHNAQTTQGTSAPRENYKDYLYGDDAIIVDDLPAGFIYSPASIVPITPPTVVYYANPYDILKQNICYQIEYYFSDENLTSDIYLRRKMDANGYIDLTLLASFNRIKALTQDIQVLVDAIKHSSLVEVNMQELKLRRRDNPEKWPLKPLLENHHLNPDVPEFVPRSISMNFTLGRN
jgi:hypothetical protein